MMRVGSPSLPLASPPQQFPVPGRSHCCSVTTVKSCSHPSEQGWKNESEILLITNKYINSLDTELTLQSICKTPTSKFKSSQEVWIPKTTCQTSYHSSLLTWGYSSPCERPLWVCPGKKSLCQSAWWSRSRRELLKGGRHFHGDKNKQYNLLLSCSP